MALKSILILCLVSVFCDCSPLSLYGRPRFTNYDDVDPWLYRYHDYHPVRTTTTTTEEPRKEYGMESKLFDDSIKTKFFVSQENKLSWYDARDSCKSMGMVLASPAANSEKMELESYIREQSLEPEDQYSGYWIGSHRISGSKPWTWETNNQEIRLFGWLPGEPNGFDGENCMELKKDGFRLGWNNLYCSSLRGYICESLPITLESDKNSIQESKKTLHEEMAKESDSIHNEAIHEWVRNHLSKHPEYEQSVRNFVGYSSEAVSSTDNSIIMNPDSDMVSDDVTASPKSSSSENTSYDEDDYPDPEYEEWNTE